MKTPTDWKERDVLVGTLHNTAQLHGNLQHLFYHMPAKLLTCKAEDVRYIAIYQSRRLFGRSAGIYLYGKVKRADRMPRGEIHEIPATARLQEEYLKFSVDGWQTLKSPVKAAGTAPGVSMLTSLYLLQNSRYFPELYIRDGSQWAVYTLLRGACVRTRKSGGSELLPTRDGCTALIAGYAIGIYTAEGVYEQYDLRAFLRKPHSFLEDMLRYIVPLG